MARRDAAGPYNLEDLRALPAPDVFERDPAVLKRQLVTWFEGETGRTLYPMQVEMLLIDMCAYIWSLLAAEGQFAHVQRYVTLADDSWLQQLGAMPGIETPMFGASRATTRLRFVLAATSTAPTVIPLGTRVSAGSEATVFLTDVDMIIPAGALIGSVTATAAVPGPAANGLLSGQISVILDPIAGVASAANASVTINGADAETPDAYRLRLANALEKTSISGQRAGYVEHCMAVSSVIIDCAAVRPQPCYVDLYPLTAFGAASPTLREQVLLEIERLQEDELLPMGDLVTVKAAEEVYIELPLHLHLAANDPVVIAAARAAADAVVAPWGKQLGSVIVPEDVRRAVRAVPGVLNVETPGFTYRRLERWQYAVIETLPPSTDVES